MNVNQDIFARTEKEASARLGSSKKAVAQHVKLLKNTWQQAQEDQAIALTNKATYRKYLRSALKTYDGADADKRVLCDVAATLAAVAGRADLRKVAVGLRDYYSVV